MRIGILREDKIPADDRVIFSPTQCKQFIKQFPTIELFVQSSSIRCFKDSEYKSLGINLVDNISNCDVFFGIKEVLIENIIPNKTYFFFSHTIKKQDYNRELLQALIEKNITMVDYEVLKDSKGKRLLGFGRYAGIVGAYNALLTYGLKSGKYKLKAAHLCKDRVEMETQLEYLNLKNEKIIVTGHGRVGHGILEILQKAKIKQVSKEDFISKTYDEVVFVHLNTMDYNVRIDGNPSDKYEFYNHPELYKSSFMKYVKHADIFIAGHYYSSGSPFLFSIEDAKSVDFKINVVADISCDIQGPIPCTIRASTIENPIYGYNPISKKEDDFTKNDIIAVMAVDNLPSELPKDASEDFGKNLLEKISPLLINADKDGVIENATICQNGNLMPNFEYLRDYLNGN
ncbi:MAG: alanine dehydrogenase [Flavobacteriales bacterium]|nr:alanine dehydrogenase [Flavobacteriales bacterium]